MGKLGNVLKRFDMNPSTEDSFKVRTASGALSVILEMTSFVVSIITVVIMASLFWGELKLYMTSVLRTEDMVIDKETKDRTVINMSIDFDRFVVLYLVLSRIPCMLIDVGYRDALGNDRTDLESEIRKTNLDVNGNLIGVTDTSTVWMII